MNKTSTLRKVKRLNWIALLIDLLFVLMFAVILGVLFTTIETPETTAQLEIPEIHLQLTYQLLGRTFSAGDINLLITIMVVFLIIGIPSLLINFKHNSKLDRLDYHQWEGTNSLIKAFISLLTLNFISFIIRIFSGYFTMIYAEGKGYIGVYKANLNLRKERKAIALKAHDEYSEEEKVLKKRVRNQTIFKILRYSATYIFLILFALFILIPFYWMILTALKTFAESKATTPALWVPLRNLQWVNIKFVIEKMDFGLYIKNTLIVALLSTLGTVIITVLSAFAFARLDFKGREAIFSLLLMTMMIPGEIYMITNFLTVSRQGFGWIGTPTSSSITYFATMIIPMMVSIFYIFFLRQTFKQVPDALYKAAKVDGASDLKFLRRVMIPIAGPTIFTITILSILGTWSAFIWPRLITSVDPVVGNNYWLISVALRENAFILDKGAGMSETMFNLQIAATAIVTVPLVIVFLLLRKYIMNGVGRSGTKG